MVLVVVAVVLAFVGAAEDPDQLPTSTGPELVAAEDLRDLEAELGHAVYWAGERPPLRIELERDVEGNVFLRYLPPEVDPGDEDASYLTVGTYPVLDAFAATQTFAREAGAEEISLDGGAILVPNPESPGGAYLAYPGSDLQIEVYDPTPGKALRLVREGAVAPVGEG